MTTSPSFERVYDRLKLTAPQWQTVRKMPLNRLRSLIADAGLSNQKAPRIKAILRRLLEDFGEVTLSRLAGWRTPRAEAYLKSLPGVDTKTAKCVLMYSLNRQVLPIDTHVWRVAIRLGILSSATPRHLIHEELEKVVPARLRYGFHVNAIAHGRTLCRALVARCESCPLRRLCDFYREGRLVGAETPER